MKFHSAHTLFVFVKATSYEQHEARIHQEMKQQPASSE